MTNEQIYAEIRLMHYEHLRALESAGWSVRRNSPWVQRILVASYGSDYRKVSFTFYQNGSVSLQIEFRDLHFLSFDLAWKALENHVNFWRNLPLPSFDESPTLIDNEIPTEE